jgi:hypothetical protein
MDQLLSVLDGACIELRKIRHSMLENAYNECSENGVES